MMSPPAAASCPAYARTDFLRHSDAIVIVTPEDIQCPIVLPIMPAP
jgi:hypothetical protein